MFERKKQPPLHTMIGEGAVFHGEIRFPGGTLQIDGEVKGDVLAVGDLPSLVQVGEKSVVMGKIHAAHVIIYGRVVGPVHADGLLELKSRASVVGSVQYHALEMQKGATIEGELQPIHPPVIEATSSVSTLASSH